jgi:hypothetical protein
MFSLVKAKRKQISYINANCKKEGCEERMVGNKKIEAVGPKAKTIEEVELKIVELKGVGKDRAIGWWGVFGNLDSEPKKYFKEENKEVSE